MLKKVFCRSALILAFFFMTLSFAHAQWQKQAVDTKAGLRGLSVVNEKVIWASGTGGTFLRTVDGGKTWKIGALPGAEKLDFRDVEAFDANTAYLLSIGEGDSSRIYKTTDGGATWKMQFKNDNPKAFFDALAFWDEQNGVAMSDPVDGYYLLRVTTDGGENWRPLSNERMPPAREGEAAFAASGTCLVAVGKSNLYLATGGKSARIFRSNDRGQNWVAADIPIISGESATGVFSVAFHNELQGVAVGGNYEKPNEGNKSLALTRDGGRTWLKGAGLSGYRSAVVFVDDATIIAVGSSGSDISRDGGKSWQNLDKENYNSVQAKGENAVWAVGANGLVAKFSLKTKNN